MKFSLTKHKFFKIIQIIKVLRNFFKGSISYYENYEEIIINLDRIKTPIIANLEICNGVGLPLFSYSKKSNHPFVLSLKYGKSIEQITKILEKYFSLFQCETVYEMFELKNQKFKSIKNWEVLMPWSEYSQKQWSDMVRRNIIIQNKRLGIVNPEEIQWTWARPTSFEKIKLEANRTMSIYKSILEKGYRRNDGDDGDIYGHLLINENMEYRWQSIQGQHRASVLSALGYDSTIVRIMKVIKRDDVLKWKNVKNGFYTKEEALKIFDSVFYSKKNKSMQNWLNYIDKLCY